MSRARAWAGSAWSLVCTSLFSAIMASIGGTTGVFLAEAVPDATHLLNGVTDWLVLPLYLGGALLMGIFLGLILGFFLIPLSLPFAVAGTAIMAFAERRSPIFRHWAWWCATSLALMPIALLCLGKLGRAAATADYEIIRLDLPALVIIGIPAAIAGALAGRHCWHIFAMPGVPFEDQPIEPSSASH